MPTDTQSVFVSYSRQDSEFVLRLVKDLNAAGASVWVDRLALKPSEHWDNAIQQALKACPRMLVILTPSSVESKNVLDELSFALGKNKTVIPVLFRDCEVPYRLSRLQHIDFRTDYAQGLKELIGFLEAANDDSIPTPVRPQTVLRKPRQRSWSLGFRVTVTLFACLVLFGGIIGRTWWGRKNDTYAPPAPTAVEAVKCGEGIEDFRACHASYPTGCTISGSAYDPYLNLMKNQTTWGFMDPREVFTSLSQVQQLEAKLPAVGINQKNHGEKLSQLRDLGEGSIYGVVGYLYDVVPEGKESSNCQLDKDPPDFKNVDYQIFVGFDPAVAEEIRNGKAASAAEKHQAMIVEMTPHYRDKFHQEWTVDALKAVKGQQVKVLGQLMMDNEHYVLGQDCGIDPSMTNCWRASVWELHPVTDFQVCRSGKCTATSAGWRPIKGR